MSVLIIACKYNHCEGKLARNGVAAGMGGNLQPQ